MMRVSQTFYDTAGPQLYYKLPKTTSPKHRRLVHTLARDKPKAVIALLRHVRIIHLSDALRSQLLLAVERDGLELAFLTHLIVDDGLGVGTAGATAIQEWEEISKVDDFTAINEPIVKSSRDLTVICHPPDLTVGMWSRTWYPFCHANVRNMTIAFDPSRYCLFISDAYGSVMSLVPSTVDKLVLILTPAKGDDYWSTKRFALGSLGLAGLVSCLAYVCLARAKRLVIVGADMLDPLLWEDGPPEGLVHGDWTMEEMEKLVKDQIRDWGPDYEGDHDLLWPDGWKEKDVNDHLDKIEFVTREEYARGLI